MAILALLFPMHCW
uniref:Uncharacterized protein n=1 Tax=Rhizophora mucronata TaxID=61149 RepID=A0A2P2P932_RHIMU